MEKGKGLIAHIGTIGHKAYTPNSLTMKIVNEHFAQCEKPNQEEIQKQFSEEIHMATIECQSYPTGRDKRRARRKQERKSK